MTFNQQLNQFVKEQGEIGATVEDIYAFCDRTGHRHETGTRELRKSRSPEIATIKNSKGDNLKYVYVGQSSTYNPEPPIPPVHYVIEPNPKPTQQLKLI